jgi:glucosamine kinase
VRLDRTAILGLDIGGSRTRARLLSGGAVVAELEGPGANVAAISPAVVERRLTTLLGKLGPVHPVACCAGVAGAEVPAARARLENLLGRLLPGTAVEVVHDARLVLAAAGIESGIALIAGTGSVAYGRAATGQEARAGGWGWLLGDEGSAAWVAREAAREVMRRADAGERPGPLGLGLLAAAGAVDSIDLSGRLHRLREPRRWASLAAAVFAAAGSDAGAGALADRAAAGLAALVAVVRTRLGAVGPVVLAGGLLLNQPLLEAGVRNRVEGPVLRLEEPPVAGAVRLASGVALGRVE